MNRKNIIKASGIYDIIIILPFALPWLVAIVVDLLHTLHVFMWFTGDFPEFSSFHLLFINIFAVLTILYSVLRVKDPSKKYLLYDTIARFCIAAIMLVYLVLYNITEIIWIFFAIEIIWWAIQLYILKKS